MGMTNDSEEDFKLHILVSLTGTPCSCLRSDSASVWASGGNGDLSGNPGAAAAANWERGRSGSNYIRVSFNRVVLVPVFFHWVRYEFYFSVFYTRVIALSTSSAFIVHT